MAQGWRGTLLGLLVVSLVLTILVIPGVGLETRSMSSFPAWQNALFSVGGPILLVVTIAALATLFWRTTVGSALAVVSGLLSLGLSVVGLARFGASAPPAGVYAADVVHLLVSIGVLAVAGALLRRP